MGDYLTALAMVAGSRDWLLAANLILSVLLLLWMLRYRRLWLSARTAEANGADLIDNLSEGIYRSSPDGRQLRANPALVRLNGYDNEAEMLASVGDIAKEWYVDPKRRRQFRELLMRDGRVKDFVSEIYRHKTRERIWVTESARLVRDERTGHALHYEGSVREITETMRRLNLEERFQKLANQVPGGLFQMIRHKGGVFSLPYTSSGFRDIFALGDGSELPSSPAFLALVHDEDRAKFIDTLRRSGEKLERLDIEFRVRKPDGPFRWLRATATPEMTEEGTLWHGYIKDISDRKESEQSIEQLAFFDPLTNLPNRRMFLDRVAESVERRQRTGGHGALLFVDLDNFKSLNDIQGHDVGDAFLVQVAERLTTAVRNGDMVARIGGDEFVILIDNAGSDHALATRKAVVAANRALASLREEFAIGPVRHTSSASIGVVVFGAEDGSAEEVLKHADVAMYRAKSNGRDSVALFDREAIDQETWRHRLFEDLKLAVSTRQLELHFQPQYDHEGRIVAAEGLVRWNHPEFGLIAPQRFVPLTERFGFVSEFNGAMLALGTAALERWTANPALARLRLAINVNGRLLGDDRFVPWLKDLLAARNVDPHRLTIEVTENLIARDIERAGQSMKLLRDMGVRMSLDDFGSGYSCLAHLKTLPLDEIKIDGSFVRDIESGETGRAFVRSILSMTRFLGLTSVAEHVENKGQEAYLRALGCDLFQGFHYAEPMDEERFVQLVATHAERSQVVVLAAK